jgi:hypothetical protein
MLVTTESVGLSQRSAADLLAWCQSGPSRAHWPGVQRIRWDDTTALPRLYYDVAIDAPGAPPGHANVEEHMCRPEEDDDGVFFESAQLWHWSSQEVGGAWGTYRFTESGGCGHLRFVFRYLLPQLGHGPGVFDRDEFCQSIDGAVEHYVRALVTAGAHGPPPVPPAGDAEGERRRLWRRRPVTP